MELKLSRTTYRMDARWTRGGGVLDQSLYKTLHSGLIVGYAAAMTLTSELLGPNDGPSEVQHHKPKLPGCCSLHVNMT